MSKTKTDGINYATQIDTFLFRRAWADVLKDFSDEDAGALMKAVFAYTEGNETVFGNATMNTVYRIMTRQMNHSAKRYLDGAKKKEPPEKSN